MSGIYNAATEARRRARGYVKASVWLSPESQVASEALRRHHKLSLAELVDKLLAEAAANIL